MTLEIVVSWVIVVFLSYVIYALIRPPLSGAVYYPSGKEDLETMIKLADAKPGRKMADLGSGDGRVVIAFAEAGMEAHGYEINPFLVLLSRRKIKKAGLKDRAFIHWQSLWKADVSQYDVIVVYGFPNMMKNLEKKLGGEAKPDARIISSVFKFPHWQPEREEPRVRLYRKQ